VRSVAANLIVSPDDSRSKLAALIRSAHHVIRLYAEEIGDTSIEKLLVTEHRKGVIVQVVLESGATPVAAAYLRVNGVSLREIGSPYIHAKVLDVDDHLAFVGSENLSTQSLDLNREVGLLIRGPDVERIVSVFESDWQRARG
jgi:cardiolipin synthase A/B